MSIGHKLAFVFFALGLSISPVGSSPMLSADTANNENASKVIVSSPLPSIAPSPDSSPLVAPSSPAPVEPIPTITEQPSREISVELAGGQDVVDLGRGPVLFSLPAGFPPYIVEHDLYGGTEQFGTLQEGMTVKMSGLVSGTYTVGQIINVPNTGTTKEFKAYKTMPKVMLQTCITGTNRMIIVGLY